MRRVLLFVCALSIVSCATESGSGFVREAAKERSAQQSDDKDHKKSDDKTDNGNAQKAPPPTLTVDATPNNARISVNGRYLGTGHASFESMGFGQKVTIVVEAPSYHPKSVAVTLWGQTETIEVNLDPITGTLVVSGDTQGVQVTLSGARASTGTSQVLIGDYTLVARRFGFTDVSQKVTIEEGQTTQVGLTFAPAPFELTALRSNHPDGFNPDSAAVAATVKFSFLASGPGRALLVLTDPTGRELARWDFPALDTWYHEVLWDGRHDGASLPDGAYTLTLSGASTAGDAAPLTRTVRIDRSLVDRDRPSLGPAPGLLWTPTPEVLSPGTVQVSVLGLGHTGALGQFPLSSTFRISPDHGWEVSGQTSFRLWTEPSLDSFYATLAVKRRIPIDSPDFRLAWVAGATLGTWLTGTPGIPPTDFLTTFPAVRALLPASWSWGKWTILVAPEVDASFWSPATAYEGAGLADGPRFWGYGRFGLAYEPGPFSLALSGVARTRGLGEGFGWRAPAQLGLEGRYPVPGSPLTLGGYLSVSAYSSTDYAWYGGFGFSLLLPASLTLDIVSQLPTSP